MNDVKKKSLLAGTGTTGVLIALLFNFTSISNELQEWYRFFVPPVANPTNQEFIEDWEKPESTLPEYVPYSERTKSGNKPKKARY